MTDHAEFFGETQVCTVPGNPGYDSQLCMDYRDVVAENYDSSTINSGGGMAVFVNSYRRRSSRVEMWRGGLG